MLLLPSSFDFLDPLIFFFSSLNIPCVCFSNGKNAGRTWGSIAGLPFNFATLQILHCIYIGFALKQFIIYLQSWGLKLPWSPSPASLSYVSVSAMGQMLEELRGASLVCTTTLPTCKFYIVFTSDLHKNSLQFTYSLEVWNFLNPLLKPHYPLCRFQQWENAGRMWGSIAGLHFNSSTLQILHCVYIGFA